MNYRPCSQTLPRRSSTAGFTLMEILFVVGLIALLMGALIKGIMGSSAAAEIKIAQTEVGSGLRLPLESFKLSMGSYPTTEEGLQALVTAPGSNSGNWRGPYYESKEAPKDPWGTPYRYAYPGSHNTTRYDIWSAGPDKKDGTADDIGNW